jgi:hypothetical protein
VGGGGLDGLWGRPRLRGCHRGGTDLGALGRARYGRGRITQQTQLDGLRPDKVLVRIEVHRSQVFFESGAALGDDRSVFRVHLQLSFTLHLGAQRLEPGLVNFVPLDARLLLRSGKDHLLVCLTFLDRFRRPGGECFPERVRPGHGDSLVVGFGLLGCGVNPSLGQLRPTTVLKVM